MIGVTYNNTPLYIPPGFAVSMELEDDIQDVLNNGEAGSYPIVLPHQGNDQLLYFAGNPTSATNHQSYDGFAITWDQMVWYDVTFVHTGNKGGIEGYFTSVGNTFYNNKRRSIRDILSTVYWDNDPTLNLIPDRKIKAHYPQAHFYGKAINTSSPLTDLKMITNQSFGRWVPWFYILDVLRECAYQLGLEIEDNFSETGGDQQKVIIGHNRSRNASAVNGLIADHLTDITLQDLVEIVAKAYGCSVTMFSKTGIIQINDLNRINEWEPYDIRGKVDPEVYTAATDFKELVVQYDLGDDSLLKDISADPTGTYIGEFDTESAFTTAATNELDYGFVKVENAYYQYKTIESTLTAQRLHMPVQPYHTSELAADPETITIKACPAEKERYVYYAAEGELEVDAGYTHIRLVGSLSEGGDVDDFVDVGDYVSFEVNPYEPIYREVTAVSTGLIEMLNDTFQSVAEVKKITIRKTINRYIPIIGHELYNPASSSPGTEMKVPRILFFHGTQSDLDSGTYEQASADSLTSAGTSIGTYTLNTQQSGSLPKTLYDRFASFLRNSMVMELICDLTPNEVREAFQRKIIRWEHGTVRVLRVSTRLTASGARDTKLEGYRR